LHLEAAKWLEAHGEIERALRHYLHGSEPELAREAVLSNRQEAFSREEAYRVQHWLRIVGDVATHDPELLLVRAWIAQKNTRYAELSDILTTLDRKLKSARGYPRAELQRLRGEAETLHSMLAYWNTDAKAAVAHADLALELLPSTDAARGFTVLIRIGSLQMLGEAKQATAFAQTLLQQKEYRHGTIHARLLQGLCYNYSFCGDTSALLRTCDALKKYGQQNQLPESLEYADYFRGIISYQLNKLPEALALLAPIVANKNLANYHIYSSSVCTLCYIHMAMGEDQKAWELAESLVDSALNSGATGSIDMAQACLADLALQQKRPLEAIRWADTFDCEQLKATTRFIMPELVYLKIRICQDTPESRREVKALLDLLQKFLERIHNVRFLAELLALRALALVKEGKREEALAAIEHAVHQAQGGGYIRLFVDIGLELAPLLNQLPLDESGLAYVGRILAALPVRTTVPAKDMASVTPLHPIGITAAAANILSLREQEILLLLAQRLNNKEIGERLFISPATVKRHAHNIYEKLGVHGRREAVAKATGLGLIPSN
jgi:LuxR family maltose regulon positive regulatory protein